MQKADAVASKHSQLVGHLNARGSDRNKTLITDINTAAQYFWHTHFSFKGIPLKSSININYVWKQKTTHTHLPLALNVT